MRARAPASSANVGPGFDTLAIALALYVDVRVEPAVELVIESRGEGAELATDADHLAAKVVREVMGHDRVHITVDSAIPVGRGLGSSAALAAAAAAAAGASDPLAVAAAVDGHPENAAASVLGGFVTATTVDGRAVATKLPLDEALGFVVLVPDRTLPTKEARAALPSTVPHRDAAFNLGRMGLLLAGLADHRRLVAAATEDRLHQSQRGALFPEAAGLLRDVVAAGALAACWSGAGPSLLAICERTTTHVIRDEATRLLAAAGVRGRALVLEADHSGITLFEGGNG